MSWFNSLSQPGQPTQQPGGQGGSWFGNVGHPSQGAQPQFAQEEERMNAPSGTSLASMANVGRSGLAAGPPQQGQASGLAAGPPQQGQVGQLASPQGTPLSSLQAQNASNFVRSQGLAGVGQPQQRGFAGTGQPQISQWGAFVPQQQQAAGGQRLGGAQMAPQQGFAQQRGPTLQQQFAAGGGGFGQPQGFLGNNPMAQFAGWGGGGLANAFRGAAPQAPQSMFGMGRSY